MRARRPSRPGADRPPGTPAGSGTAPGRPSSDRAAAAAFPRRLRFRGRGAAALGATLGLGVCTVGACALLVPGLVFGAGRTEPPALPEQTAAQQPASAQLPSSEPKQVDSPAVGHLLVTLPWGAGEGEVGLVQPAEGLTRGPEALAAAPDGSIAVLDSVNRRVLFLDGQGSHLRTVAVPLAEPRFIAVSEDRVYVLDCDADRRLATLDWSGAFFGTVMLPELSDVVTGLFATSEGPCVEVAHDSVLLVTPSIEAAAQLDMEDQQAQRTDRPIPASLRPIGGRPVEAGLARMAKVTFRRGEHVRIRMLALGAGAAQAAQKADFRQPLAPGRSLDHLVSVDGDGRGGLVVGARLLDPGPPEASRAALIVTRLAATQAGGAGLSAPVDPRRAQTLLLADSPYAYLGRPYVVTPDGRVLQPVGSDAGYSIMVHQFATDDSAGRDRGVQP